MGMTPLIATPVGVALMAFLDVSRGPLFSSLFDKPYALTSFIDVVIPMAITLVSWSCWGRKGP